MVLRRPHGPVQAAKTPRVIEAQTLAITETDINMIMLANGFIHINDAQAAGHTQVQNRRTGLGLEQQVFCTPPNHVDSLPVQPRCQLP